MNVILVLDDLPWYADDYTDDDESDVEDNQQ